MAKKSKTQRAKASAARSARRAQARQEAERAVEAKDVTEADASVEAPKKSLLSKVLKRNDATSASKQSKISEKKTEKKIEKKIKKPSFFKEVRLEMKRVTWPTKQDVLRWSVVVVSALIFFGVYVAILDNLIITPALIGVSSLGALL